MNQARTWVRITPVESIPLREGRSVRVGGFDIAIFNLGDRFLAVENRCPHRGGPLADGIVSGTRVVCPLHAWKVDLPTGEVVNQSGFSACVQTFRVRIEAGVIAVELPSKPAGKQSNGNTCGAHTEPKSLSASSRSGLTALSSSPADMHLGQSPELKRREFANLLGE